MHGKHLIGPVGDPEADAFSPCEVPLQQLIRQPVVVVVDPVLRSRFFVDAPMIPNDGRDIHPPERIVQQFKPGDEMVNEVEQARVDRRPARWTAISQLWALTCSTCSGVTTPSQCQSEASRMGTPVV